MRASGLAAVDTVARRICAGMSWSKPAKLIFTEEPNEYGKYWTWVFWELEVETHKLLASPEVSCRAWDTTQNTQPYVLTWNILGQGNNSMFRLCVHKELDEQVFTFGTCINHLLPQSCNLLNLHDFYSITNLQIYNPVKCVYICTDAHPMG